jgi:hypothetical protein
MQTPAWKLPDDVTIDVIIPKIFPTWEREVQIKLFEQINECGNGNLETAEHLRELFGTASCTEGNLWRTLCLAVAEVVPRFDSICHNRMQRRLTEVEAPGFAGGPGLATPPVYIPVSQTSSVGGSPTTPTAGLMHSFFSPVHNASTSATTPSPDSLDVILEARRRHQTAVKFQEAFLKTGRSKKLLFNNSKNPKYLQKNAECFRMLQENMQAAQDSMGKPVEQLVMPMWTYQSSNQRNWADTRDQMCRAVNTRQGVPFGSTCDGVDSMYLSDESGLTSQSDGTVSKQKVKQVQQTKKINAAQRANEITASVQQLTLFRKQKVCLKKEITKQQQLNENMQVAGLLEKLAVVEKKITQEVQRQNVLVGKEQRAASDRAAKKAQKEGADWRKLAKGILDVCDDPTDFTTTNQSTSSSASEYESWVYSISKDDALLCGKLRSELLRIRDREYTDEAYPLRSDEEAATDGMIHAGVSTWVGRMELLGNSFVKARKAYCKLSGHKEVDGCICQKQLAVMKLLNDTKGSLVFVSTAMKAAGFRPSAMSITNAKKWLEVMPVFAFMVPMRAGGNVEDCGQYVVQLKEEGLDYAAHAVLVHSLSSHFDERMQLVGEQSVLSKEDLKAFKMMCSSSRDARLLEEAVMHPLSANRALKQYGKHVSTLKGEAREALELVKSMIRTVDVLIATKVSGEEDAITLLEDQFCINDKTLKTHMDSLRHDFDDEDEDEDEQLMEAVRSAQAAGKDVDWSLVEKQSMEQWLEEEAPELKALCKEKLDDVDADEYLLHHLENIYSVKDVNGACFKRFERECEKCVDEAMMDCTGAEFKELEMAASALDDQLSVLSGEERLEKLEEEGEEDILVGTDDEDEEMDMDALEVFTGVGDKDLAKIAAYRKLQNERKLKRRLVHKVRALQVGQLTRSPSLRDTIVKYPDILDVCYKLLADHGHGASKWRDSSRAVSIHRSTQKGAGLKGLWRALRDMNYNVAYSTVCELGACSNSRKSARKWYRNLLEMKMIRMCKRAREFNVDCKHQIVQYHQFNLILQRLQEAEGEVDAVIINRDDHAIVRAGTGATTNQRRVLQCIDVPTQRVDEFQHDYCDPLATKLQATATLVMGLGQVDGQHVLTRQLVHCKAVQVTPSTSTQLVHDLYQMLEAPDNQSVFYNEDGSIKRLWHVRADGGENESINVMYNNALWTDFQERTGIEVLLVTHNESGGNTRELIERLQASITDATVGFVAPTVQRDEVSNESTSVLDKEKVEAHHLRVLDAYTERIDGAPGLRQGDCLLHAVNSTHLINESSMCPPDLFQREEVWKLYFKSGTSAKKKKELKQLHPQWILEAERMEAMYKAHAAGHPRSRYCLSLVVCGDGAMCRSKHCEEHPVAVGPSEWCQNGPDPRVGVIFPQWDPDREGSYLVPEKVWELAESGRENTPDKHLPSRLLRYYHERLTNGDKKKVISAANCQMVADAIKDSSITKAVVEEYFKKLRLSHLRRVVAAAKRRGKDVSIPDLTREGASVNLLDAERPSGRRARADQDGGAQAPGRGRPQRQRIAVEEQEEEQEEEMLVAEEELIADPDDPVTLRKAVEQHGAVLQTLAEADEHLRGKLTHKRGGLLQGTINRSAMGTMTLQILFHFSETWGWAKGVLKPQSITANWKCDVTCTYDHNGQQVTNRCVVLSRCCSWGSCTH